jgi:NADH dehydrogenase
VDRAGRAFVNPDLSIPDHREVFVVGDAAAVRQQTGGILPGVAQVAMQGAARAAKNVLRLIERQPTREFVYRDKGSMAIIGRGSAVADLGWTRFAGLPAWFVWLFIHIFMLIGFRNRLAVMLQWAGSYLTFQRSVRLITNARLVRR